jgi:hypothetical protein
MRDIRSDLQERANATEEEIRAINADYEKMIEQLQKEREEKLDRVKSKLELISKLIEFENADAGKVPSVTPPEVLPQLSHVGPPPNASVAPTPLAQMIGFRKVG